MIWCRCHLMSPVRIPDRVGVGSASYVKAVLPGRDA